ncbi:MAG: sigma 54 modulation/S30EA ribosomal C-terminal domain-containing protein, partial [Acetobacteraceae bacterium]
AEHIAKRLRRYRRRLNEHARDLANRERPEMARQYVLSQEEPAGGSDAALSSAVIAEAAAEIRFLSVSDAVMRLDLTDQQVMMFRNKATGELNVLYRRPDGNIGWIEPTGKH